jgi:hypothetical protein
MALTLAEVSDPAGRLAFIARAVQRSRIASHGGPGIARTERAAVTASAAPVPAPVRPKAVKRALTVADLSDDDRRRIELAFHESGHSVSAVVLGGRLYSSVVAAGGWIGTQGLTTMAEMPVGDRTAEIAFGGVWAQARWRAGRRPARRDMYAVLDTTGSRDHREHLRGETGVRNRVEPLMERCWPSIVKVAQKLLRDNEVRHDDVCRALGLSDAGGPGSFELALIRSGQAPGTFTVTRAAL